MRPFGLIISVLAHILIVGTSYFSLSYMPHLPPPDEAPIYHVDLVDQPGQPPVPEESPEEIPVEESASTPFLASEQYEQMVKEISPVKRDDMTPQETLSRDIYFGNNTLKQGNEIRLSLRALGAYDFTQDDYLGHYMVNGEGRRYVTIIDGRAQYGTLLLYDSGTGMYRQLFEFGKYIYVYGPSFSQRKPVEGSVTFFPHKTGPTELPSRLLWLPDEPPQKVCTKVFFPERELSFQSGEATLAATLTLPPPAEDDTGTYPAILFLPGSCAPRETFAGFARMLALQGYAALVFEPAGCGDSTGDPATDMEALADDARAAFRALASQPDVDTYGITPWGRDWGAQTALRLVDLAPEALILTFAAHGPQRDLPGLDPAAVERVHIPSLWLFSGQDPAVYWADYLDVLGNCPAHLSALVTTPADIQVGDVAGPHYDFEWLRVLAPKYAAQAMPWIKER